MPKVPKIEKLRTKDKGKKIKDKGKRISETSFNLDALVKTRKWPVSVIPAKAGIQVFRGVTNPLDSGFHRCDDFFRSRQLFSFILLPVICSLPTAYSLLPTCLTWSKGGCPG
jgi:hypothetical protein